MPLFEYRAISSLGKTLKGVVDADSELAAKERLRREEILITFLAKVQEKRKEPRLSAPMLLAFTRELAQLLRAGLPVYESLLTIEEKYRQHSCHSLLLDLSDRLKQGESLSTALKRYSKTFSPIYLALVQTAEQTGGLPAAFQELAALIVRQQKLKKQLLSAIAYPAFLASFCLLIVFTLLFFIIPTLQDLFEGRELHPVTQIVLSLSQFLRENTTLVAASLLTLILLGIYAYRTAPLYTSLQRLLLRLPLFKGLILHAALARFCRAASALLSGGVALLEALPMARSVLKQKALEEIIASTEKKIAEGASFSKEMGAAPLIPPLIVRMLALAEETGEMAGVLQKLAEIYEEELEKALEQLTSFLQPALLLILGAIVGLVLLSVLLPLTDVGSFLN